MSEVLTVVCTDRGAHKPRVLGRVGLRAGWDGLGIEPVYPRGQYGHANKPSMLESLVGDEGRIRLEFTCPTCGRTELMREERLLLAADTGNDGAPHWRVSSLDISHLPS